MRKKIGKRIGTGPIILAVFALAALLSVGLLATLNGNVTQAQGLPGTKVTAADDKCEVLIHGTGFVTMAEVRDGGCFVSGESVDVVFKNTGDGAADDRSIAVYVTGGDDFPGLQATNIDGDNVVTNLGEEGVDEHLITVDAQEPGFGVGQNVPGTATITVNRDMAKNGEVYLFVYRAGADNDADGKTFPDDVGVPISVLTKEVKVGAAPNTLQLTALGITGINTGELLAVVDLAVEAARQDPDTGGVLAPLFETEDLPLISSTGEANPNTVARAESNLKIATDTITKIKNHDDYDATGRSNVTKAVMAADVVIMQARSAIDAIEGADPSYFLNDDADIAVKVNFRDTAVEAKKVGGEYVDFDNKERGSEIYVGRESILPIDENSDIRTGAEEATVTVAIKDANGVALSGFVDFSIDTSAAGAADVVFALSSRSSHYVELLKTGTNRGSATVTIEGLPKIDPLKIPVTASFNNGELELAGNIIRKGDAMMVEATAYVCEEDDDDKTEDHDGDGASGAGATPEIVTNNTICYSEIAALGTPKTSDDPDEVVALGPEDTFFIYAKATDAVGNKVGGGSNLSWELTASADNADDAEKAIPAADGDTNETILVASGNDAVPGTYNITVTSPDGEASTMVMVTVSDAASMIEVSCDPMMIPTTSGLTECSIMVTDLNGNVPSNLHDNEKDDGSGRDMARVAVRSTDVILIGTDENDVELDDEGMAMFSILLREDAPEGSSITVNVSATISGGTALQDSTVVMYGDPQSEPGMSMELGDPSITSVMSEAEGMTTVMLMPGDNADQHWIWALPTDRVSEGMFSDRVAGDATSFTMSGLTSGMSYWFTAVAGRDMEDGTQEWSMYSGWSAETRIE